MSDVTVLHACQIRSGGLTFKIVINVLAGFLHEVPLDKVHAGLPEMCETAGIIHALGYALLSTFPCEFNNLLHF